MAAIIIFLFRLLILFMIKPFNMYTQGSDTKEEEEEEEEDEEKEEPKDKELRSKEKIAKTGVEKHKDKDIEKTKDKEEAEDFHDVYEEEVVTKTTIHFIENTNALKIQINENRNTEVLPNFTQNKNSDIFYEAENVNRGGIESSQLCNTLFELEDTCKMNRHNDELDTAHDSSEANDDNSDALLYEKKNEKKHAFEKKVTNSMNRMLSAGSDAIKEKNKEYKHMQESIRQKEKKEMEVHIKDMDADIEDMESKKDLFLNSRDNGVNYATTQYKSANEAKRKSENGNTHLKGIYKKLSTSSTYDLKELTEYPVKSSSNGGSRSSSRRGRSSRGSSSSIKNHSHESDELFLKKIEYSSSTDGDHDVFSTDAFDMTKSAAYIWNSLNKLQQEKKSDLESTDSFSNFLKNGYSSDDSEQQTSFVDYNAAPLNFESEETKQQATDTLYEEREQKKDRLREIINNYSSKEFDTQIKINKMEQIPEYTNLEKWDRTDKNNAQKSVKSEAMLFNVTENTDSEKNNIEKEKNTNLPNILKNSVEEKYHCEKESSNIKSPRLPPLFKDIGRETKEQKDDNMDNKTEGSNSEKRQNWVSFRKNSIVHFLAQRTNTFSVNLKRENQKERNEERNQTERDEGRNQTMESTKEVEKNVLENLSNKILKMEGAERANQEIMALREPGKEKKVQEEEKREWETERAREEKKGEAQRKKGNQEDKQNNERKDKTEDLILEETNKNYTDDVEVYVNFNDDEQWGEENIESEYTAWKNTNFKGHNIKETKEKRDAKNKIDITNENNEKTKIEKIKLPTKKKSPNKKGNEIGKTKQTIGTKEHNEENEELNVLGRELNKQIMKLEKEQEKVKKLEYELIAKSAEIELEREDMKNKAEEERKKMLKTIEEEKRKWKKEKKRIEAEVEKQRNIILNRKKLTNEIALYKNKIKEVEEMLEKEKKQHKIVTDKLKKQVEKLTKENEKIKMELQISEEYRNKLENYQQKTILKLAKNVNEHTSKKTSSYALKERDEQRENTEEVENGQIEQLTYAGTITEKENHKEKGEKHKIIDAEIYYSENTSDQSTSEKLQSREMKKILHEQESTRFDESDIIYADISKKDDTIRNSSHTEKSMNCSSNDIKNQKKRLSVNTLFEHKNATKKEEEKKRKENMTKEQEIDINLKKMKKMIQQQKVRHTDERSNTDVTDESTSATYNKTGMDNKLEADNTTTTSTIFSSKKYLFDNKQKQKNNFNEKIKLYMDPSVQRETKKEDNWEDSQFLYSYPYSKQVVMQKEKSKTKNYETMFANLNEKICVDNLSDKLSKKKKKNHTQMHDFPNSYNQQYGNTADTLKSLKINIERNENINALHKAEKQRTDTSSHFENSLSAEITNDTNQNIKKKNDLNVFGKNWEFLLHFNFEDLFEKCENIMKSALSLSKKIKYRQAFVDGKVETLFEDGLKIIEKNKNKKLIHPDNFIIHLFHNKNYKARLPNSYVLYHFANKGIYQVNIPNVCQLNKFPNGQIDCKYRDGHTQILFSDGKRKEILPNKEEYTFSLNGTMKRLK